MGIISYQYYLTNVPDGIETMYENNSPPKIIQRINEGDNDFDVNKDKKRKPINFKDEEDDQVFHDKLYLWGSFIDRFFFHHGTITFKIPDWINLADA